MNHPATALDVLSRRSTWSAEASDNLPWLQTLPTGCASLCITSPPYEKARTYGVDFKLTGQRWVDWMVPRVVQACRVVNGLVCVNMAPQLVDGSCSPVVEWLVADLTRHHGLVLGPAPYVFFRFSIPGSGGQHYHRRDWEPVYAFCRPECLPLTWSDNTACGHPPKWAPGGEMSNRLTSGARVNQWGRTGGHESGGTRGAHGKRQRKSRPSHKTVEAGQQEQTLPGMDLEVATLPDLEVHPLLEGGGRGKGIGRDPDGSLVLRVSKKRSKPAANRHANGERKEEVYECPVLANPGNVVQEVYPAETVRQLLEDLATRRIDPGDVIRCLVGGGQMGSKLAHENEAPFPETLVSFFVRSFAPPDSIVLDPFVGSGTTPAVAVRLGRRAISCDLRPGQVALARRRIAAETPSLFA